MVTGLPRCSRPHRSGAVSCAALAAIAATLSAVTPAAAAERRGSTLPYISEHVFAVGYHRIAEAYIQPVDMHRLGFDGLKALRTIDPDVDVQRDEAAVRVYTSGRPEAVYASPLPSSAGGWATLTATAVERLRARSATLRDASPERIYQAVFDAVTADLDGYSRYAGAARATSERAQRDGYGGIGVVLDSMGGRHAVRTVVPDGPAARHGVRDGDIVVAIDDKPVADLDETALRDRLRGPTGTLVHLTLRRDDDYSFRRVSIRRERVVPNTVTHAVEAGGVAVITVERFNAATAARLREAVAEAVRTMGPAARGLILDLRGNPGGLLDQAVSVADLFIPHGRIISTEGRHPDSRQRFDAASDDVAGGLPLVVLVDGRSASAAEVVAAALQDSGRAVVVGASSFGKGSVQTVTRLPNDGELFLTWSRIYTPAGYTLHRQGVQPVICTSRDPLDAERLLEDLREGRARLPAEVSSWRAAAADDETALNHLRAACPWKDHAPDLDVQVARRLLSEPGLYTRALAIASTTVAER
ncbi:S41 family peptidase [Azospirillum halopraeferens]|uniref:S41 family peptidase n=1 Tax=Azospirillum halopraeferens TaxID=34010 RepID=UPI00040886DF|nr:S41 family peptidase [Azospirillum halopraeferens]